MILMQSNNQLHIFSNVLSLNHSYFNTDDISFSLGSCCLLVFDIEQILLVLLALFFEVVLLIFCLIFLLLSS